MKNFAWILCNVLIEQLRECLWEIEDKRICLHWLLFTFLIFDMFTSTWRNKFPQFKIDCPVKLNAVKSEGSFSC